VSCWWRGTQDESHFLKSGKAKRTLALLPLLQSAARTILLSGTPALSRPAELFTQIQAVSPKLFANFAQYGKRYCAGVKVPAAAALSAAFAPNGWGP
jgi:SNF2 family DNA or RNA helicase